MTPNHAKLGDGTTAGTVTVTAYQYKSRKWVKVKSAVRTLSATSAYTWSWRPRYKGTYRWATSFAGDVDHVAAVEPLPLREGVLSRTPCGPGRTSRLPRPPHASARRPVHDRAAVLEPDSLPATTVRCTRDSAGA